ncbi:hypothetical protein [Neobacillus kokaensis]|uniref:Uncharacterized protein n=1 Tax=Neobacillus kokaensis TaxID=2759023 RepID=A0ABQ3N5D4_9BACI|nr:hypothetical protein [Neobacillus kokaensis]GHH98727.1 hypothetical protein AM1BK_22700 [Neobacillus kokaensis]
MQGSLVFIGEKIREHEWKITRKPEFYDAILLTHQTSQTEKAEENRYQSIPLPSANFKFNLGDHNIYFTYNNQKIQFEKDREDLSEEEVFDVFNSLLLKEGTRVSYLVQMPKWITIPIKKEKIRVLAEAKKLEENETKK